MSGVYIHGMEMPKDGYRQVFITAEGKVLYYPSSPKNGALQFKAVPVPDHGKLGDLDKLVAAYDAEHVGPPGRARELMMEAPTVIPADKEETDV